MNDLSSEAGKIVDETGQSIEKNAWEKIGFLDQDMKILQEKVGHDIRTFGEHANKINLSAIAFQAPEHISLGELEYRPSFRDNNYISEKKLSRKEYKKQKGFFGWLKRNIDFFGQDWGVDEIETIDDYFVLNKEKLEQDLKVSIGQAKQSIRNQVGKNIMQPVQDSSREFFKEVHRSFSQVQQILQDGLNDQKREKAEAEKLRDETTRSEERRVGKECRSRWSPYH